MSESNLPISKINTSDWFEVRCAYCSDPKYQPKILLKVTVESLTDDDQPKRKIGLESKCKDCYKFTYMAIVV